MQLLKEAIETHPSYKNFKFWEFVLKEDIGLNNERRDGPDGEDQDDDDDDDDDDDGNVRDNHPVNDKSDGTHNDNNGTNVQPHVSGESECDEHLTQLFVSPTLRHMLETPVIQSNQGTYNKKYVTNI